jgi:hypothetical protein
MRDHKDIKLTEKIFYWTNAETFYHTNKKGIFCHSFNSSSWRSVNMQCRKCGYKASNKEKFIIKLMKF